jgi:hypothetical protein
MMIVMPNAIHLPFGDWKLSFQVMRGSGHGSATARITTGTYRLMIARATPDLAYGLVFRRNNLRAPHTTTTNFLKEKMSICLAM